MKFLRLPKFITRLWRFLKKPELLFYAMLYFMVLLIIGTVAQKHMGLFPATEMFFNSFIVWYGILPLPAGATILSLIFINLLVHFISVSKWDISSFGMTLSHLSVLILLLGGGVTLMTKKEGFIVLRLNETTRDVYDYKEENLLRPDIKPQFSLPFSLTLQGFKQNYYQGTDIAQAYESDLSVNDTHQSWPALIAMNSPLRYKGYTFYQSSVLTLPNKEIASVLNVVENPAWLFPYIATGSLFIGLAFHAGRRRYEQK